ncbi:MAG: N-acetyl-gamma-glutamyl-phosphate reductase, partial [Syntrophales bacterium]|nr:N-acetyl-gamma-glutamyl-phosphate reductase [Syntrophales bacterium]
RRDMSAADLISLYRAFYRDEKFVRICPEGALPNVSSVRGTNCCDIGFAVDGEQRRVAVCSAIDNLFKGAAGQAIQNMNIMTGLEEDTALDMLALFP